MLAGPPMMALLEKALLGVTLLPLLISWVQLKPGLDEDNKAGSDVGEEVLMGAAAEGGWEVRRGDEILWEELGAGRPVLCCSNAARALPISSRSSVLRCSSDCCCLNVMADNWCGAGLFLVGKLPDLLPSLS